MLFSYSFFVDNEQHNCLVFVEKTKKSFSSISLVAAGSSVLLAIISIWSDIWQRWNSIFSSWDLAKLVWNWIPARFCRSAPERQIFQRICVCLAPGKPQTMAPSGAKLIVSFPRAVNKNINFFPWIIPSSPSMWKFPFDMESSNAKQGLRYFVLSGVFLDKTYFPIFVPIGLIGNVLSFLVSISVACLTEHVSHKSPKTHLLGEVFWKTTSVLPNHQWNTSEVTLAKLTSGCDKIIFASRNHASRNEVWVFDERGQWLSSFLPGREHKWSSPEWSHLCAVKSCHQQNHSALLLCPGQELPEWDPGSQIIRWCASAWDQPTLRTVEKTWLHICVLVCLWHCGTSTDSSDRGLVVPHGHRLWWNRNVLRNSVRLAKSTISLKYHEIPSDFTFPCRWWPRSRIATCPSPYTSPFSP